MATPPYDPKKAALYNQLRQRGLSEDEAWAQSGISEAETYNYVIGINGELGSNLARGSKVAGVDYERPSAAEQAESNRWFQSLESGDDDEPPARTSGVFARTTFPQAPSGQPAQQPSVKTFTSTTTSQETVTGGSETTIRVGAYERRDTAASRAVQTELDQTNLEIERRKEVLRAEGKNFREMNRDPELFELKAKATTQEIAVENAKQTVEIAPPTTVTTPGPSGTTFQQSVNQQFLTTKTAGEDPTASLAEYDNFTSSGGPVRNSQAQDVTDTGGVPTQSLADIDGDTGFVPQRQPAAITDTGGVPTQSLADIDGDTGFVPQSQPTPVTTADAPGGGFVFDPDTGELLPADSAQAEEIRAEERRIENVAAANPGRNLSEAFDPETQTYGVWDNDTGVFVETGLTEQEATIRAQDGSFEDLEREPLPENFEPGAVTEDPQATPNGVPFDDEGNLNPGWTLDGDGNPVFIGTDFVDPSLTASAAATRAAQEAAQQQATLERARVQAVLANQIRQADSGDWRFKIRLAPGARYLYRGDDGQGIQSGILAPLAVTDGVIFPYTPSITTSYRARYAEQDLPHSNYRGYFYSGSNVEQVQVTGTFTAQDTAEANYLLAVIHFFRSVTKMFYGQDDANRGAPPPLVFLQGFGAYQFSRHPCVVTNFNYVLPADVDYIRADVQPISGLNIQQGRRPGGVPPQSLPTNVFTGAMARLANAGVSKGAIFRPPAGENLGTIAPTYVPTKMDMTIELLPMQTRQQVSQEFSMREFANGSLLRKGFW